MWVCLVTISTYIAVNRVDSQEERVVPSNLKRSIGELRLTIIWLVSAPNDELSIGRVQCFRELSCDVSNRSGGDLLGLLIGQEAGGFGEEYIW